MLSSLLGKQLKKVKSVKSVVIFVPSSLCGQFCLLPVTHLLPKSRSAKKWFKKCAFWYIFAQNTFISDKKMQKSAKKH